MHAKNQDGSRSKISRWKEMFRARFISGLRDFTRHLNFRYFARATYNRNLDSLRGRVHSSYVVCRLRTRLKTLLSLLKWRSLFFITLSKLKIILKHFPRAGNDCSRKPIYWGHKVGIIFVLFVLPSIAHWIGLTHYFVIGTVAREWDISIKSRHKLLVRYNSALLCIDGDLCLW